jgi:uncharacterized membrane protein YjjP (DUF1212 family)
MPFLGEYNSKADFLRELYFSRWIEGFGVGLSCGIFVCILISRKN